MLSDFELSCLLFAFNTIHTIKPKIYAHNLKKYLLISIKTYNNSSIHIQLKRVICICLYIIVIRYLYY